MLDEVADFILKGDKDSALKKIEELRELIGQVEEENKRLLQFIEKLGGSNG